ncbi:MAG: S41 family peptidase [Candidatus Saccharibacteria bacterium]
MNKINNKDDKLSLKKRNILDLKLSSAILFVIVAFSIGLGFLAGNYKYQIIAAVGPVFGYKSHDASLNLSSLEETYSKLASNYDGNLDSQLLIEGANRGMVAAAGDNYTEYMSQKEAADFDNSLSGNIGGGIGAEIGIKNKKIIVIRALADNPAKKVGLGADDIILSVNDQTTEGLTVEEAVGLIRGDVGTTVKIIIQRGTEIKEFVITREIINNPSIESNVSKEGIGILTISRFDNQTGGLARIAAQGFKKQNVKAVILDLRGNGGGYVSAARDIASLWLNDKIVMTEKSGDKVREVIRTQGETILAGLPTVVLINGGSASASEIVAGALRDYGVAKLVGEKSYGKGSMQQLLPLSDGAQIKVTIAKWYTPNNYNLNKNGLEPDVAVSLTQLDIDNGIDAQIEAAKKSLGF